MREEGIRKVREGDVTLETRGQRERQRCKDTMLWL